MNELPLGDHIWLCITTSFVVLTNTVAVLRSTIVKGLIQTTVERSGEIESIVLFNAGNAEVIVESIPVLSA